VCWGPRSGRGIWATRHFSFEIRRLLTLLILFFEPALLVREKVVEFPNQLDESGVISLLLDQCAQAVHAFSFIGFHRLLRWKRSKAGFLRQGRIFEVELPEKWAEKSSKGELHLKYSPQLSGFSSQSRLLF
jgi:hypothetical protein